MRRILRSRLAIAIAASVLTITAIGGITYATSTTSGDTYYACAAVNGMIRPSWIRLNTAPTKCPATTDHIVQWAAGGQPIAPKAGIVIPLSGPVSMTRPGLQGNSPVAEWAAVDTSMCRSLVAYVKYSGESPGAIGDSLNLAVRDELPGQSDAYRGVVGGEGTEIVLPVQTAGPFTGTGRASFASASGVIGPKTVLRGSLYWRNAGNSVEPGLTVTVDQAWLYCTPY